MNNCIVGIADGKVSCEPLDTLVTYALGSCIGLAVYDPGLPVGGLLHFMLPDSDLDEEGARTRPCKFADSGMRWLFQELAVRGAHRDRLRVWIAGGASVQNDSRLFQVGLRNDDAIRRLVARAGLQLDGEDVGGTKVRTMGLELSTGVCWVESLDAIAGKRNRISWRGK
jgi:chemotaxis protein CheD